MCKFKKFIIGLVLICFSIICVFSQNNNLHYTQLSNGLDVFVMENHNAPLVYIEVALKAGAIKQSYETAGLFHLYEHILFKGNSKYKSAEEVQSALRDFGVSSWNGSTGDEYVNYYFTIPSNLLEEGLEFWAVALQEPLIDEDELEKEKKVVISEINGDLAMPGKQLSQGINKYLFPKAPWQLDPAGFQKNIEKCTRDDLIKIKNTFYVANNAAIFIGGDVDKNHAVELVEKYYGKWESAIVPVHTEQLEKPFSKPKYIVQQDPGMSPQTAQIMLLYTGPNSGKDTAATYAADVWGNLLLNPQNKFTKRLCKDKTLKLPGPDYLMAWYQTKLASGRINFMAAFNHSDNVVNLAEHFYNTIAKTEIPKMIKNKNYFSKKEYENIHKVSKDEKLISQETAKGFLSELRFWWASAPKDYFFTYHENLEKVSPSDIGDFLQKYVVENHPLIVVKVHPAVYESQKESFTAANYINITAENAFYWNDDQTKIKEASNSLEILTLDNGIPLYIQQNQNNSIDNLRIFVLGGVAANGMEENNIEGIEGVLFDMMTNGSKKYKNEKLMQILHEKNASITGYTRNDFSQLQLNCLDHYFDELLPVFLDLFLNPEYDKKQLENLIINYESSNARELEDPEALLNKIVKENIFKNHPYEASAYPTNDSIKLINKKTLQLHHKKILNSSRIVIVGAGNFKIQDLYTKLNSTLGKLPTKPFTPPVIENIKLSQKNVIEKCESAKGTAFKEIIFSYPKLTSPDFYAAELCRIMFNEVLFNIVREKNGTCYSTGCGYLGTKITKGYLYGSNINNIENFDKSLQEAFQYFDSLPLAEIEKRLIGYKNTYINAQYSNQFTNSGLASSLAYYILFYNDYKELEKLEQKVNKVTSEDIKNVFKKYWLDSEKAEFTVSGL